MSRSIYSKLIALVAITLWSCQQTPELAGSPLDASAETDGGGRGDAEPAADSGEIAPSAGRGEAGRGEAGSGEAGRGEAIGGAGAGGMGVSDAAGSGGAGGAS
ncbi:MAG TPA: hypothetical protein VJV78_16050, partial [Polyangiales bacterium]|nr:hypothetical protein [Polyangiales bacterium]